MLKNNFEFDNKEYVLSFELPTVSQVLEIDAQSYDGLYFSNMNELKGILTNIPFDLHSNGELVISSKTNQNITNLNFFLLRHVAMLIKPHLSLSEADSAAFTLLCDKYIEDNNISSKMPPEMLLAQNLHNSTLSLNMRDFDTMPMIKYEKIQIALSCLKKKGNV